MNVTKQWQRHKQAVSKIAEERQGISFNSAPFDIVDKLGLFYEVKTPSDLKGKHKGECRECRITLSDDEKKFGELFKEKYRILILFNDAN